MPLKTHKVIFNQIKIQYVIIYHEINSRFTPATDLKVGTFALIPNFITQEGFSKKLQPLRKGSYQIIDKPTD